jgi:hypothetical protein
MGRVDLLSPKYPCLSALERVIVILSQAKDDALYCSFWSR